MARKEEKEEATPSVNSEKLKALQLTLDKIEKSYGKGAVMKLGDNPAIENIEVI
ncbi:MAG: DNA recombination/repair protein RecA, partial [Bacteroidales bacterium]|nr:DNA recombination/repair protein RecA [Bacteroidales bacterium]